MHRLIQQLLAGTCLATGVSAALVIPAFAQTSVAPAADQDVHRDQLEEVIVTAQLRSENVIDTPMAISTVSGAALQEQHITNIADLSYSIPDLDVAKLGLGQQIIAVRGLSGERGSSSLTGIYLDNVPISGLQDGFLQTYPDVGMYDLQRVEVLKGPQGTLFGEGSVGGTVRFLTNAPNLTRFGGSISATAFGTLNGQPSKDLIAVANIPVVTDRFAIRIATDLQSDGGWIDQPSTGRTDINNSSQVDSRVSALWTPTDVLKISGLFAFHRGEAGASDIVNQGYPEKSNFIQAVFPYAPTNLWDEFHIYNLSITYDLGFAELLSSTSNTYRQSMQNNTEDWGGNTAVAPADQVYLPDYTQTSRATSEELRLTSTQQGAVKWLVGAEYKNSSEASNDIGEYVSLFNGAFTGDFPYVFLTNESKSSTVYGDVSYKVADRIELGGGLRYFHDERSAFDPASTAAPESATFNDLTYRYTASYSFAPEVKAYATVGTGFRSGGFNSPTEVTEGAPESFGPEKDKTYEAGLKSTFFQNRVSFDTAVFYSQYTDLQDDVIESGNGSTGGNPIQFTSNGQSAELRGVEWGAAWKVNSSLRLSLAGDVIRTRITKTLPGNSYNVGDPISYVPRNSFTVAADYDFNWTSNVGGFLHVDVDEKGKSFDTLNGLVAYGTPRQVSAPAVTFVNLNIGATRDDWTFTLFGRNLSNELQPIRASAYGWTSQARPLNVGVTIYRAF